jgi:hypothetical protein
MEERVQFHEYDKPTDVLYPFVLYSIDAIADGDFVFDVCA